MALLAQKRDQEHEEVLNVIDMGTGCGNLAISLALNTSRISVLASDISRGALEVARRNVAAFKLQGRISLFCGDLFSPFDIAEYRERIHMVVCNPPYIPTRSLAKLPSEIITQEPVLALDGGALGIDFYRGVISGAIPLLDNDGILVFEAGIGQDKLIVRLLEGKGYQEIKVYDQRSDVRIVSAIKKQKPGNRYSS